MENARGEGDATGKGTWVEVAHDDLAARDEEDDSGVAAVRTLVEGGLVGLQASASAM